MTVMEAWDQVAFQYRDDDGSESGATDRQAVNINDTLNLDTNYRMRLGVQGAHTGGAGNFDLTVAFQYNVDAAGWNNITTTSSNVRAVGSIHFTDDDVTTEQLAQSQTFVAGHMDDDGDCPAVSISETGESEFEICFQLRSAELSGGEAVEIRAVDSGVALATYTQTPSITVASSGITVAEIMAALAGKGQQYPARLTPRAHVESTTIDAFFGTPPIPPEESRLIGAVYSMSPSRVG